LIEGAGLREVRYKPLPGYKQKPADRKVGGLFGFQAAGVSLTKPGRYLD